MKIKNIYTILLAGTLLSACQDKFLDLQPISSATTGNFYKNADDIKNAVTGAYASLQAGGISTNNYVFGEVRSDNTVPVASGSVTDQDEFDRFYIRTTNPFINDRWNNGYRSISRCNAILDRIGGITMDENLKNRYTAEVKFIRALVYFELVRTYGDIPLVLKEITDPDAGYEYGRNPKAEVYAQIEKDLTEAEAVLPVTYTGTDIGRATKGATKALLGKVYLTQRNFQGAANKLKEVIDLGVYGLLPEYADVFDSNNENHRENIFDIQFRSGGVGEGSPWPNAFAPENSGNAVIPFGGGGNNQPTLDLINSYEPNDKRKNFSLATSYVNASGATIPYNFIRKYRDVPATSGDNDNNIPIIRYADVILMYAEALNELGYQPTGNAFTYLNQVRTRAGLKGLTSVEVPNQEAFRLAMEQERRVEFAFESHRWFDLVRTGRAIPVMNSKKDQFRLVKTVSETDLVFPIPQSQIDINRDKIQQNPGYN
ncbi:RagB/SusD family nutrient uptake outer membrane protein [Adhaeribacter aerolatus]|nr:RagB/SusD family nutrient uptake outer membrane protein [Adhaeribacter aerolatus]